MLIANKASHGAKKIMRQHHAQQNLPWNLSRLFRLLPSAIVLYVAYSYYRDNQTYNEQNAKAVKTAQIIRDSCGLETLSHRETEQPYCRDFRSMFKVCLGDKEEGCGHHEEIKEIRRYACNVGEFFMQEANRNGLGCDSDIFEYTP